MTTQLQGRLVRCRPQPRTPLDPRSRSLNLVAIFRSRRAVTGRNHQRIPIERPILMRVVEHAAAVVVDEALRWRATADEDGHYCFAVAL